MPDAEQLGRDFDFATLAIAHNILTREDIETAMAILDQEKLRGEAPREIEDVLLERGLIRAEEVWAIYKARDRLLRDVQSVGQRIGGYEILCKVGEGGLGVVYKARQLSMGRMVALKVLHEKWVGDDEFRKRFLVEARLVGRLSHQNLIQVFDVGRHKNTLYYSMEFVDGETVEDMIDRDGAFVPADAIDIIFQVARALKYLDEKEIVHRDVKPGNIILTKEGMAKLGDFGFVKSSLDSVLSSEGEVLGTPDYISPEAARGDKNLDARSDMYSLGATLYHMLAGKPPFGGSSSDVLEAHIRETPPPLTSLNPNLPPILVKAVERMMAKDASRRYANYVEMFNEMDKVRAAVEDLVPANAPGSRRSRRTSSKMDQLLLRQRDLLRLQKFLIFVVVVETLTLAGLVAHLFSQ